VNDPASVDVRPRAVARLAEEGSKRLVDLRTHLGSDGVAKVEGEAAVLPLGAGLEPRRERRVDGQRVKDLPLLGRALGRGVEDAQATE